MNQYIIWIDYNLSMHLLMDIWVVSSFLALVKTIAVNICPL